MCTVNAGVQPENTMFELVGVKPPRFLSLTFSLTNLVARDAISHNIVVGPTLAAAALCQPNQILLC